MTHIRYVELFILTIGLSAFTLSCENKTSVDQMPVAKVNGHVIAEKDFRRALATSAHLRGIVGLSFKDKKNLLEEQIRKEVLIQVAVEQGLDKEESFRRSIEKFWEQTLITALLQKENSNLETGLIVTKEEIEARYQDLSRSESETSSMAEVMPRLEKQIREEKKTEALDKWIERLLKDADIAIYEENLRSIR